MYASISEFSYSINLKRQYLEIFDFWFFSLLNHFFLVKSGVKKRNFVNMNLLLFGCKYTCTPGIQWFNTCRKTHTNLPTSERIPGYHCGKHSRAPLWKSYNLGSKIHFKTYRTRSVSFKVNTTLRAIDVILNTYTRRSRFEIGVKNVVLWKEENYVPKISSGCPFKLVRRTFLCLGGPITDLFSIFIKLSLRRHGPEIMLQTLP